MQSDLGYRHRTRTAKRFASTYSDVAGFSGGDGGAALSPDGSQLATIITGGEKPEIKIGIWFRGEGALSSAGQKSTVRRSFFAADGRLLVWDC